MGNFRPDGQYDCDCGICNFCNGKSGPPYAAEIVALSTRLAQMEVVCKEVVREYYHDMDGDWQSIARMAKEALTPAPVSEFVLVRRDDLEKWQQKAGAIFDAPGDVNLVAREALDISEGILKLLKAALGVTP